MQPGPEKDLGNRLWREAACALKDDLLLPPGVHRVHLVLGLYYVEFWANPTYWLEEMAMLV